jgi:nickel-type superoxide dismutase maturation protease
MIRIMKVTGESLSPFFQQGDFVIILMRRFIFRRLKPGDVVVFHHPGYGKLIKRVQTVAPGGDELFVVGTRPESTDSREFGPIPLRWVIGMVIFHI